VCAREELSRNAIMALSLSSISRITVPSAPSVFARINVKPSNSVTTTYRLVMKNNFR